MLMYQPNVSLFAFSALVLAFQLLTVSVACRFYDWQFVVLREINFLLKICRYSLLISHVESSYLNTDMWQF